MCADHFSPFGLQSELALSLHPRPLASLIQAPVLDPAHASSSLHMVSRKVLCGEAVKCCMVKLKQAHTVKWFAA